MMSFSPKPLRRHAPGRGAWLAAIAAALLWPLAASAGEELVAIYGPALTQCYDQADDAGAREKCIGATADPCMAQEDGGQSTSGIAGCNMAEAAVWDAILNTEYQAAIAGAQAADEDDSFLFPSYANRVAKLRIAERAWIAFRDAECDLAYAAWGAGSARHTAAACYLRMNAERSIALRELRGIYE